MEIEVGLCLLWIEPLFHIGFTSFSFLHLIHHLKRLASVRLLGLSLVSLDYLIVVSFWFSGLIDWVQKMVKHLCSIRLGQLVQLLKCLLYFPLLVIWLIWFILDLVKTRVMFEVRPWMESKPTVVQPQWWSMGRWVGRNYSDHLKGGVWFLFLVGHQVL